MTLCKEKRIRRAFGFVADPEKSLLEYNKIENNCFRNLCKTLTPPELVGALLGLGLKFCLESRQIEDSTLTAGISRMKRDVRL